MDNENEKEIDDVSFEENIEDDSMGTDPVLKVKKLKEELKKTQVERGEYLDGWQRSRADYLNLKKDSDARHAALSKHAKLAIIESFFPLYDSFELAFANKEAWMCAPENWRQGVEYIFQQLKTIFQHNGVEEINPLGEKFDHTKHHSIATVEVEDETKDGVIMEVAKKGFEAHGQILRPAQVKVGEFKRGN
jgi:molecular chaperone GrpE